MSIPRLLLALVPAAAIGLGGCVMQPSISAPVTTADGQHLVVPVNEGNVTPSDGTLTVESFQFGPWEMGPDRPPAIVATFVVKFKEGAVPASVVVEDDTEEPILKIFEDLKPHVVKNGLWGGASPPFLPQDPHVNWMLTLDDNIRVYRFTIKLTDGTTHVLLKPVFVPVSMKKFMQRQMRLE